MEYNLSQLKVFTQNKTDQGQFTVKGSSILGTLN